MGFRNLPCSQLADSLISKEETLLGCYNSTVVKASLEKTWEVLSNFHDFSWCPDVVESVEKVGDEGSHQIGTRRILNGVFHETLVAIDNDAHILQYSIDDGPDAVSKENVRGYIGESGSSRSPTVTPLSFSGRRVGTPAAVELKNSVIPSIKPC
jgi:hypothetical protein